MTDIEKLRRMLDERGVEHLGDGYQHITTYRMADALASVTETSTGKLMLRATFETPEQAIAATLGRGTCQMEYVERPTKSTLDAMGVYFCSECGSPTYNDCMPRYCIYCGAEVSA